MGTSRTSGALLDRAHSTTCGDLHLDRAAAGEQVQGLSRAKLGCHIPLRRHGGWLPAARRFDAAALLSDLTAHRPERLTHVEHIPARRGRTADWPEWISDLLAERLQLAGIECPWQHQVDAAAHAHAGRS